MSSPVNLTENLKKLKEIADWFDDQENLDVEQGLLKVKEATILIKESRGRLSEVKNEFTEIKKEIETEQLDPVNQSTVVDKVDDSTF